MEAMFVSPYDYSDLCKVYIDTGVATREPVEPGLNGATREQLADANVIWVAYFPNFAWWPAEFQPFLGEYQSYDETVPEVLTSDPARKVVVSLRAIRNWTAEEIEADIAPKRVEAIGSTNRDSDAFYNAFIGQREWEDVIRAKAQAFADAGYTGDVPAAVAAMMTENSLTAQEAADAIIGKFADQSGVMGQVFAKREKCQAAMRSATVNDELNPAVAEWNTFFTDLCTSLQIVPRYTY